MNALASFVAEIELLSELWLREYLKRVQLEAPTRPKEINDPVWGTIAFTSTEVVILDSPVLQRLRRIRQLGVVHLVYPGATHTRFDHSLGIVSRVSALIDAINGTSTQGGESPKPIDRQLRQRMRLAALCHDIGHGFMSHVSEKAIERDFRINALQRDFNAEFDVENARLSEMVGFILIRSKAFVELLNTAWATSLAGPPADIGEFISDVVVGRTVSDDIPLLHELVSGPFDADKLDYLTRDAYYCGVPQIVDIPRLVQKIRVAQTTREYLPREIALKVAGGPNRVYSVTAVASSGASTLDELALARALLHDKVYRHKKVRSAEAMVASVLTILAALHSQPELLPISLHDESFLDLDESRIRSLVGASEGVEVEKVRTAADLVTRLRQRHLFVRAFSWSQAPSAVGSSTEEEQTERLHELLLDLRRTNQRGQIAQDIADRVAEILTDVGELTVLSGFDGLRLKSYIWIDPPSVAKGRGLLTRAYLQNHEGVLERFGDVYPDTEGWSDQYLVNREIGYVFAPRSLASAVYLATEEVFRLKFGVRVPANTGEADSAVSSTRLASLRRTLTVNGYYDGKPSDLLPVPSVLSSAGSEQRIDAFVANAREHASPVVGDDASGAYRSLTRLAVVDFLRQFRSDDLVAEALDVVTRIRFLSRGEAVQGLVTFLERYPALRD